MKFPKYTCIFLLALFGACQNGQDKEIRDGKAGRMETRKDSVVESASANGVSAKTITFLNEIAFSKYVKSKSSVMVDWNRFTLKGFWKEDFQKNVPFREKRKYYELYGRFLRYSPDSTMFIDLDSYNIRIHKDKNGRLIGDDLEPDTEISLVDLKNNTKKRLVFLGPGNSVEDAAWIDNQNFILVGYQQSETDNNTLAVIWKFDMASQSGYLYELNDSTMVTELKDFSKNGRLKDVVLH